MLSTFFCLLKVVIDLSKLRRRRPRKCQLGSIEVVDLSLVEEKESEADVCATLQISDKEEDSVDQPDDCQNVSSLETQTSQSLIEESTQRREPKSNFCLPSDCEVLTVSEKEGNDLQTDDQSEVPPPAALNVTQNISVENSHPINSTEKGSIHLESELLTLEQCSSQKCSSESIPSPFSLDSPYHCPSEIDPLSFSDESNMPEVKDTTYTTDIFDQLAEPSCIPYESTIPEAQSNSTSSGLTDVCQESRVPTSSSAPQSDFSDIGHLTSLPASDIASLWTETQTSCTPNSPGRPDSDVSKTIQTAVSTTQQHSVPCPQSCLLDVLSERDCQELEGEKLNNGLGQVDHQRKDSGSRMVSDCGPEISGQELQVKQYISHIQLKKLKKQMGTVVQHLVSLFYLLPLSIENNVKGL